MEVHKQPVDRDARLAFGEELSPGAGLIFHERNVWSNIRGKFSGEIVQEKCLGLCKTGMSGEVNFSWGNVRGNA